MVALGADGVASLALDPGDVARVRLIPTLGPLSETLLSLRLAWQRPPSPLIAAWRCSVHGRLGDWAAPLQLLARLWPPIDLHTIVGEAPEIEPGLDALLSAPAELLHAEVEPFVRSSDSGPDWMRAWLHELARGDARALEALVGLVRRYHRCAVAPYWEAIRTFLAADHAERGQVMVRTGVDGFLGSLHPEVSWRPPHLGVGAGAGSGGRTGTTSPVPAAGGRSLVLVPSVFCLDRPLLLRGRADTAPSPYALVYPALRTVSDAGSLWNPDAPDATALARLLGKTRANALQAVAERHATTTGLARRLRVSPATASHHLAVLRAACLVTSNRKGNEVGHRITPLGAALLDHERTPNCPCDGPHASP